MEITWLGNSCFQLRGKNVVLVTDPFLPQGEQSDLSRPRKINPAIITVSSKRVGQDFIQGIEGNARVINAPGEYEISDVLITGVASYQDNKRGQVHGRNTIYIIHMDELVICHLGNLGHALYEEQLEEVADADVLLIPIGGENTTAAQAAEIISQVEPRIVIPMQYQPVTADTAIDPAQTPDPLEKFCREMGVEKTDLQPKLNVTKSSLPTSMQVVVLSVR
ncbi:MAG: MBL fold metallo-hydrolase [Ktedonobacteraceae bacterium]|nr:MBL fold metallo-hydrolase [Ktedonobacteraceae bacterium]